MSQVRNVRGLCVDTNTKTIRAIAPTATADEATCSGKILNMLVVSADLRMGTCSWQGRAPSAAWIHHLFTFVIALSA